MEKFETAMVDTIHTAKEFIKGGIDVMAETIDQFKETLIGGKDTKEEQKAYNLDLRTEEERFKAGLRKVIF